MSVADLGRFADGFTSYRKQMAAVPHTLRLGIFMNACNEVATYVAKGLDRALAADELVDMATANGLDNDPDAVQFVISEAFAKVEDPDRVPDDIPDVEPQHRNGKQQKPGIRILSENDFVSGFVPPDYLIEGMLQRRFIYALTGQTGHAKTAIALVLAELVSSSGPNDKFLGTHRVKRGNAIYFVGENPDDIRMRVIGARSLNADDDAHIWYIAGQFNIADAYARISSHAESIGGLDLVLIDTSAAYFLGQDEINNTQMGAHARMLRKLTELPGGPCVVVLCHPIKYTTEPSQLLPRGGGAFLNEMDGNLTAWKHDDNLIEFHHGKIRGPGFEPMTFKLETIRTPTLTDADGRELPTVRAVAITQSDEDQQTSKARGDEDHVLAARLKVDDAGLSIAEIATRLGWLFADGTPAKSRVQRTLERLEKAKPALVYRDRGQWKLTEKGKEAARKAALRIAAEDERKRNDQIRMDLH